MKKANKKAKAAARDAIGVSTVRDRRMFCNFVERQQLVEGAPVSRDPFGVYQYRSRAE